MFRIIQGGVSSDNKSYPPYFWLVCDNKSCGVAARCSLPVFQPEDDAQKLAQGCQDAFLKKASEEGWMIGLDAQYCPDHTKALIAVYKANEDNNRKMAPKGVGTGRDVGGGSAGLVLATTEADVKRAKEFADAKAKADEGLKNGFTNAKVGVS